jgi:ACR3 family arsenite transporter
MNSSNLGKLSIKDKFLSFWILSAMILGLAIGKSAPYISSDLNKIQISSTSLPVAFGLLIMMYPVLAKVNYSKIKISYSESKLILVSLFLNWIIGPIAMFLLAWMLLYNDPQFRTGLILIGIARCIAMVLVWNDLAGGDSILGVLLVGFNSIFQLFTYTFYSYIFLTWLPEGLGLPAQEIHVSFVKILFNVLIYLGIPMVLGVVTSTSVRHKKGNRFYEKNVVPKLAPLSFVGLLFTIIVLFALQSRSVLADPKGIVKIAVPLILYFILMFFISFVIGIYSKFKYSKTTTLAFTAAGNNFELAIAVSVATFGITSKVALAGTVGPLIEVPVLLSLAYLSLFLQKLFFKT